MATPGTGTRGDLEPTASRVVWIVEHASSDARLALQRLGRSHTVESFTDDAAMIERLAVGPRPQLLVLDGALAGETSAAVCRAVRAQFSAADLPILVVADAAQPGAIDAALDAGADDFVTPFASEPEFRARVAALLHATRLAARAAVASNARLRALADAAIALVDAPTLEATMQLVAERAASLIGAHQSIVTLKRGRDWAGALSAATLSEKYAAWRADAFELGAAAGDSGIFADVSAAGRPARMTQAEMDLHPRRWDFSREPPTRGWLAVPLVGSDGRSVGMIQLSDRFEGQFTADDEATLAQFAQMASVVIQNRLLTRAEARAVSEERDARASQTVAEAAQLRAEELQARAEELGAEAERMRAELEAQSVELKRSNSELEQFAYVASHDLQEPLRMVSSYVQLLARRYQGRLDADADKFIGYATDGAARMQQLINDLLALSRVGSRGHNRAPVDLEQLFARVLADLQTTIEETRAEVTHDPLPSVAGDRGQLAQLFQNLVGNAIKFRGENIPRVHVTSQPDGKRWRFSVEDQGIGIEPQYFDRIFVIFQRLHGPKKYPGTGIGLALCRKIVERHGGKIWVESDPGRGTTFFFTLPDASAAEPYQKAQTGP